MHFRREEFLLDIRGRGDLLYFKLVMFCWVFSPLRLIQMVHVLYLSSWISLLVYLFSPACCIWIEIGFEQTLALVCVYSLRD